MHQWKVLFIGFFVSCFLSPLSARALDSDLLLKEVVTQWAVSGDEGTLFTKRVPVIVPIVDTRPFRNVIDNTRLLNEWVIELFLNPLEIACLVGDLSWVKWLSHQMTAQQILERSKLVVSYYDNRRPESLIRYNHFTYLNALEFCLQYDVKTKDHIKGLFKDRFASDIATSSALELFEQNQSRSDQPSYENPDVSFRYELVSAILDQLEGVENFHYPKPATIPVSFRIRLIESEHQEVTDIQNAFVIDQYDYYGVYPLFLAFQQGDPHAVLRLLKHPEFRAQLNLFARFANHENRFLISPAEAAAREGKTRSLYALFYYADQQDRTHASVSLFDQFRVWIDNTQLSQQAANIGLKDRLETRFIRDVRKIRVLPIHETEMNLAEFDHRSEFDWAILNRHLNTVIFLENRSVGANSSIQGIRTQGLSKILRIARKEVFEELQNCRETEQRWQVVRRISKNIGNKLADILLALRVQEKSESEKNWDSTEIQEIQEHVVSRDLRKIDTLKLDSVNFSLENFEDTLSDLYTIASRYLALTEESLILEALGAKAYEELSDDTELRGRGKLRHLVNIGLTIEAYLRAQLVPMHPNQNVISAEMNPVWRFANQFGLMRLFQETPAVQAARAFVRWLDYRIEMKLLVPKVSVSVAAQLLGALSKARQYPEFNSLFSLSSFPAHFKRYIDFDTESPDAWMEQFEFSKNETLSFSDLREIRTQMMKAIRRSSQSDLPIRIFAHNVKVAIGSQTNKMAKAMAVSRSVLSDHSMFKQFRLLLENRLDQVKLVGIRKSSIASEGRVALAKDSKLATTIASDNLPSLSEVENELDSEKNREHTLLMLKHFRKAESGSKNLDPRSWISTSF